MEQTMIKVTINGETREYPKMTPYSEIIKKRVMRQNRVSSDRSDPRTESSVKATETEGMTHKFITQGQCRSKNLSEKCDLYSCDNFLM